MRPRSWLRRVKTMRRSLRRARLPPVAWALLTAAALAGIGFAYQLARKPTELLALLVPSAPKKPDATWAQYGRFFEAHSTEVVAPELLAALAQAESAGDPLARTYWRWRWTWNPLALYAPASSAVGLLQMTDGTYAGARRLCIHGHTVAETGAWSDPGTCWFNALYLRTLPGDAIEMTAAWLHRSVDQILSEQRITRASAPQKRALAAIVHLCGRERGSAFARRGFWVLPGERCGDHDVAQYLRRVDELTRTFARIARRADGR